MFGVSFLYPAFLIGLLAAAVPVYLHLRRRQVAPPVRFPAVRFLMRAPVEATRPKRLRELLLLALRVGALILAVAAVADEAAVVAEPATARGVARAAVDALEPGSGATRYQVALDRAEALIG